MSATLPLDVLPTAARAPKPALLDLAPDTLRAWLADRGETPMRARQIRGWVLERRATSFDEMTDLPKALRRELADAFDVLGTRVEKHLVAADATNKLLLRTHDGHFIECVLIQEDGRHTACVSTQVGCGMGCVFCASGLNGVERNLTAGEIVEQLVRLRNLTPPDRRLTHIVVMGMGEPLANLDNLLAALAVAGDEHGLGIGARHVTISTVGLPAKIRRLADLGKQYHLAVSLHAPNDQLRNELVPVNARIGIAAILEAADEFFEQTGRRVTYEYVVLGGRNDSADCARELAGQLHGRNAHVNLIPMNAVSELAFHDPEAERLRAFVAILEAGGVTTTVRKRKGADIDAACGQLAAGREAGATR